MIAALLVALITALAGAAGAQELALDPRGARVAPRALVLGAGCAGGEIYDDGEAENGYSGNPDAVNDLQAVQRFQPTAYPATYDTVCVAFAAPGGPNLDFEIEVHDDDGPGGSPGTLLGSLPVSASGIPSELPCRFYQYDISSLGLTIASGRVWIGVRWDPGAFPARFLCADESPATPLQPGFINFNTGDGWEATQALFPDHRAKLVRAVPRVVEAEVLFPAALDVDLADLEGSDGNGVFEPGEEVEVAPAWTNGLPASQDLKGTASEFIGPLGPDYDLEVFVADYGTVASDETASCRDSGTCYRMRIGPDGVARPVQHWDATFDETLSEGSIHPWTLHVGDSFDDVLPEQLFYPFIETMLHRGVTSGCGGADYCPAASVTRGQMAIFVLRALLGAVYTPPDCSGVFADVPCPSTFAAWIEDLAGRGIVSGCGGDDYCPAASVTRAQMAVFLLRGLAGPDYTPPACTGEFDDVPCPSLFADWVEDLAGRGITSGCGGGNYCPVDPVSRGQMGVFLSRAFGLTLYGP